MIDKVIVTWPDGYSAIFNHPQDKFVFRGVVRNHIRPCLIRIFGDDSHKEAMDRVLKDTSAVIAHTGKILVNGESADRFLEKRKSAVL